MASSEYTCAACGKTYPKGWTDEEAAAERERDFPGMDDDEAAVVCDDCYQAMRKRAAAAGVPWSWRDEAGVVNEAVDPPQLEPADA